MLLDYTFLTVLCGFISLILMSQNIKAHGHMNTRRPYEQHLMFVLKSM